MIRQHGPLGAGDLTVVEVTGPEIDRPRAERWAALYNDAFAAPPWNEPPVTPDGYLAAKRNQFARPGFSALEARRADGRTAAVGYGWPFGPELVGEPFYRALRAGLPDVHDRLLRERVYEYQELMVASDLRRQGVGQAMNELMARLRGVVWGATHPDRLAWFTRGGWQSLGRFTARATWIHPDETTEESVDVVLLDRRRLPGHPRHHRD